MQIMTNDEYRAIESYMLLNMNDKAHDRHHVYRVLNAALDIAGHEGAGEIAADVLIAACLLHDIGREAQSADNSLCHAQVGSIMAHDYLLSRGWPVSAAAHAKDCIATHRYRRGTVPQSIEARILFDADKLEASGAIGIARTLIYGGQVAEPLYIIDESGNIITGGGGAEISSFMQEYNYKLKNVYSAFYTKRAKDIAAKRQETAIAFYEALYSEINDNYKNGIDSYFNG